jgi:hypothetical protein
MEGPQRTLRIKIEDSASSCLQPRLRDQSNAARIRNLRRWQQKQTVFVKPEGIPTHYDPFTAVWWSAV